MARPRNEEKERKSPPKMASDEYVSQFYIDPKNLDPDFKYRFVETHCMNAETQSLGIALREGWEPVALINLPEFAKTAELMASIRGRASKDEFVRIGDQILMRIPIEKWTVLRKQERKTSKQQMNRLEWAEQSASIKAPTFVTDNEYSRTQELSKAAAKAFADDEE